MRDGRRAGSASITRITASRSAPSSTSVCSSARWLSCSHVRARSSAARVGGEVVRADRRAVHAHAELQPSDLDSAGRISRSGNVLRIGPGTRARVIAAGSNGSRQRRRRPQHDARVAPDDDRRAGALVKRIERQVHRPRRRADCGRGRARPAPAGRSGGSARRCRLCVDLGGQRRVVEHAAGSRRRRRPPRGRRARRTSWAR